MLILRSAKLHWNDSQLFSRSSHALGDRLGKKKNRPKDEGWHKTISTLGLQHERLRTMQNVSRPGRKNLGQRSSNLFAGKMFPRLLFYIEMILWLIPFHYLWCYFFILKKPSRTPNSVEEGDDDDDFLWGAWLFFIIRTLLPEEFDTPKKTLFSSFCLASSWKSLT